MPSEELTRQFERATDQHRRSVEELVPLLERMTLESVAEVLPGAQELQVRGEVNEDWIPILRIQRVLDETGTILFDVELGHDRVVEDRIDTVNTDYLDLLVDLTGDEFMGTKTIDRTMAGP